MPKTDNNTSNNNLKLQTGLAIASFVVGTLIGCVSLFFVKPPDEISNSALILTSDFLLMCSAIIGVNIAFDYKLLRFRTTVLKSLENNNDDEQDEKEK